MRLSNEEIVNAVVTTKTKTEAAYKLGISRATLYNYLRKPEIKQRLQDLSNHVESELRWKTEQHLRKALDNVMWALYSTDGRFKYSAGKLFVEKFWALYKEQRKKDDQFVPKSQPVSDNRAYDNTLPEEKWITITEESLQDEIRRCQGN